MRFKRNYIGALKNWASWIISRFKPLTVHTEAIIFDSVWEEIKKKVEEKKIVKWYIMTPVNYDLYKSSFNAKISKSEISKIMKERYLWMIKKNQKLELHIHLSLIMDNLSYEEQDKLFRESINWIKKELKFTPKEFVPGWWSYNKNTLKLCKKYGLKMIYSKDYDFCHDYEWGL